tara:strand:+ start:486 stop:1268 length:783 start_codon:yes stop_codon:yes gene_type:complete
MSISSTNPTLFNNVTTDSIRYTPKIEAVDNIDPNLLETYGNEWGESNEIIEKTFAFKFTPNVEDATSGNTLPFQNQIPFTYLTVPIPLVETAPSGNPDVETLERVFQYNALYVDATIFYFDSPQGIINNDNGTPLVPGGINFEHFGCIHWREPQSNLTDSQPISNQYFDSELVIKNYVNRRQYSVSFGLDSAPQDPFVINPDIAEIYPISTDPLANPINFNYDLSQFECKLTANPFVNIPDPNNFGEVYSIVVKGRYLLM